MVCRACRLCDVWSHVTWSIANEIEVKESHEQRCDLVLKSGMTPMTQKTSSKRAILTYMEMCSLKRKFKLITCVTSEVRSRQSSSCRCSLKPGALKNFRNFTGKHLLKSFFNKVSGLQAWGLQPFSKETPWRSPWRPQHRCFPVKSARTPFCTELFRWLLL